MTSSAYYLNILKFSVLVLTKFMLDLCLNKFYIGSTTLQLKCRITDHKSLSGRTNLPISIPPLSSISEHQLNTGHQIDLKKFNTIGFKNSIS